MKLSELIAHVGDENIKVQRVDSCCSGATTDKRGNTTLKIETNQLSAADVLALTEGVMPAMHGLIIWIPRDKLLHKITTNDKTK